MSGGSGERRPWPGLRGPGRGSAGDDPTGRLTVALPGAVPGSLVRLVPPALVLVAGAAVAADRVAWALLVALAALAAWRPSGVVPAGVAVVLAVHLLWAGDPGLVLLAVSVLGVHLVAASAGFARHVAWRGLVDPAALGRLVVDLVPVQVVSQVLVVVVVLLARGGTAGAGSVTSVVLRAAAVLALAGVVLVALPRRRR